VEFAAQVLWFTCLISKNENLPPLKKLIAQVNAKRTEVINMSHGQKRTRLIAWSFRTP
jgi:23S rRNA (adenine1618-N6)-methyltransferase